MNSANSLTFPARVAAEKIAADVAGSVSGMEGAVPQMASQYSNRVTLQKFCQLRTLLTPPFRLLAPWRCLRLASHLGLSLGVGLTFAFSRNLGFALP